MLEVSFYKLCVFFFFYAGYVDDPRNTDNSWMETVAINFHDEDNQVAKEIKLEAGTFLKIGKNYVFKLLNFILKEMMRVRDKSNEKIKKT